MNEDKEHLRLLAICHYVYAALMLFFSCIPLFYVGIGLAFALGNFPEPNKGPNGPPPEFIGWIFVAIGVVLMLMILAFAAGVAYAGRCLQQRRHHVFCMVMAVLTCMNVPIGTCLGIFTIIVLVRPSVKALFEQATTTELQTEPWEKAQS